MSDYEYYCLDCKQNTEVVFDHSAGDTICLDCGLVLQSHALDETSEWRTFANDSQDNDNDPVRVGGPANIFLNHANLATFITKPNGVTSAFLSTTLARRGSNPDQSLILAFKTIATMCDRLDLVATIKNRANEIFKKLHDHKKSGRGRNQDAILAGCLYMACRQENKPRTVKEIFSVANGATIKDIGRAKEYIVKQLQLEMGESVGTGTIHARDFMRRFCSHLGMANQTVKAAQESVHKSEAFDIRRSPISIAAAIIYIVSQLSNNKKPLKDVAVATGVAQGTIRNSYKDLYPHLTKIVPTWYAREKDIKNLSL